MNHHESGGLSADHDVEIFRAWKRAFPAYAWEKAEVDRHGGLTLFDHSYGMVTSLHFQHASCGFEGTGAHATVTILQEAGFGDVETLSRTIFTEEKAKLTKP